jgi:nucleoside-diphosphate-sugar epimerase
MRVLIVGCGYVGLPLGAELVRLGHEVFGLRRNASAEIELKAAGIKPLIADITKPEILAKLPCEFDWVVNCVSSTGGNAEDYRQVYLQGTRNLIEWLAPSPPKKFVYTSSTSVYGQTDGSQVKESSPTAPAAETAKILVETEKLLLASAFPLNRPSATFSPSGGEGRDEGASAAKETTPNGQNMPAFSAVILRVAGIYGPDRGHWFKQFLKNEARIEGDGSRILNMIHRDDLIGCIIAALKSGRPGEIYNAVDDEPVSQANFFQWLAATVGKYPPPSAPENPVEDRKRGVTNKRVLNRRLKMELGYQFKYPNFRKGYTAEILRLEHAGELHITPDER